MVWLIEEMVGGKGWGVGVVRVWVSVSDFCIGFGISFIVFLFVDVKGLFELS